MNSNQVKLDTFTRKKRSRSKRNRFKKKRRCKKSHLPVGKKPPRLVTMAKKLKEPAPQHSLDFGQSFWNNYRRALEWQSSLVETFWKTRASHLYRENQALKQQIAQSSHLPPNLPHPPDHHPESYEEEECIDENELDYEVSDEFVKYLEESLLLKKCMKQKPKKEEKPKEEIRNDRREYSENSRGNDEIVSAPEEDMAAKRSKEMRQLYGEESAKIHGMETAMHLGFIRKCDKKKPVFWPVVSLANP